VVFNVVLIVRQIIVTEVLAYWAYHVYVVAGIIPELLSIFKCYLELLL